MQLHTRTLRRGAASFLAATLLATSLTACADKEDTVAEAAEIVEQYETADQGTRDNTPRLLSPLAEGDASSGTLLGTGPVLETGTADPSVDNVLVDTSHMADGYIAASYQGPSPKVKLQITPPNDVTYTYDLTTDGTFHYFPLSDGDGEYSVGAYTNIEGTMYATAYAVDLQVKLADEFGPFLYPNQYVWFTKDTRAIGLAKDLAASSDSDLDVITVVYNWTVANITYDLEEAETVESGYIPDVDEVMDTGKGICFDYASLMAAMLRSQGIPTRMEIGYAGTAYHAWISTYIEDKGWVNGIIQFDGVDWSLMDPTFASSQTMKNFEDFIGDGSNYRTVYNY